MTTAALACNGGHLPPPQAGPVDTVEAPPTQVLAMPQAPPPRERLRCFWMSNEAPWPWIEFPVLDQLACQDSDSCSDGGGGRSGGGCYKWATSANTHGISWLKDAVGHDPIATGPERNPQP
jgi:hypothetical protein